ncbi:fumarylacetoacetate hydrolase family protein [Amycolatopsis pigmentata]|uniref:Fumarylacetoacetate hydrolase family protein n=1 Tax=Amycolatopsis pigmentata TaxID=450801 RepID=A0ABW5FLA7_9PSEU
MRLVTAAGRLTLLSPDGKTELDGMASDRLFGWDVAELSAGRFDSSPQGVYARWAEFRAWVAETNPSAGEIKPQLIDPMSLGPVAPRPPQVFAVGLNYRDHATESGMAIPDEPLVFTKYASAFTGPYGEIALSPGDVDWEVELVAVIGIGGHRIQEADGWDHVAGLTVGQDLSDRVTQFAVAPPQFGMGKSYPGFAPVGPALVTVDELRAAGHDPDDLEIGCAVNAQTVQKSRTGQMVFSVPALVAKLSEVVTLLPGDVMFTGTPAGVGVGQDPPRFLAEGDELTTWCEGIGRLRHRLVGKAAS